jgi:hypothetical protein
MLALVGFLLIGAEAESSSERLSVTFEGHVASITPFGDTHVKESHPSNGRRERGDDEVEHESDNAERAGRRQSDRGSHASCALTSGDVLVCATALFEEAPPICAPIDESTCDFSLELPMENETAISSLFFVQDDDGSQEPDPTERVATLIDEEEGAPVCGGDVVRCEDVDIDFAEAAPSAASIYKSSDVCAQS